MLNDMFGSRVSTHQCKLDFVDQRKVEAAQAMVCLPWLSEARDFLLLELVQVKESHALTGISHVAGRPWCTCRSNDSIAALRYTSATSRPICT